MTRKKYIYAQSNFNRVLIDIFYIKESIIGFNHNDFRIRILEELSYLGYEKEEFAKAIFIKNHRMLDLLNKSVEFTFEEVDKIKKKLGMD